MANKYTIEEVNSLLPKLPMFTRQSVFDSPFYRIDTNYGEKGCYIGVVAEDFINSLLSGDAYYLGERDDFALNHMKRFLFEIPIEQVPLHLDVFPEIAKWRLKIGK